MGILFQTFISDAQKLVIAPRTSYQNIRPDIYLKKSDGGYIGIQSMVKDISKKKYYQSPNIFRTAVTLVSFDKDLNKIKEVALNNGEPTYSPELTQLVQSGGKYYFLYCMPSTEEKIGSIGVMEVNPETLQTGTETVIAEESSINEKLPFFILELESIVKYSSSPDHTYHSIYVKDNKGDFFITCLNSQLKPIWQNKVEIPGFKPDDVDDVVVDDNGNTFIAASKRGKKSETVVTIFDTKGTSKTKEINFSETEPVHTKMAISKTGKLLLCGGYSETGGNVAGVYKAELNTSTFALENIQKNPFPDSMIERLHKDGFAKLRDKKFGIIEYEFFCRCYIQDNDMLQLLIECKHTLGADGKYFGAGSLVVSNFIQQGAVFAHIPRYAVAIDEPHTFERVSTYFGTSVHNKLVLVYADNAANIDRPLYEPQKVLNGTKDGAFFAAVIGADGKIERTILNSTNDLTEAINKFLIEKVKK